VQKRPIVLITNSIAPYSYDAARVLAISTGTPYRFRYKKRWVANNLKLDELHGRSAVLVFRDFDTGSLTPLRRVTLCQIERLGDILHVRFIASDYLDATTRQLVADRIESQLGTENVANQGGHPLSPLVFELKEEAMRPRIMSREEEVATWDEIVSAIGMLPVFSRYSFFKMFDVKTSDGMSSGFMSAEPKPTRAYLVRPNRYYSLELLQKCPWDIERSERTDPFVVEVSSPDSDLKIRRKAQRVVGNYDLLTFAVSTPDITAQRYVQLDFETKGGQAPDSNAPFLTTVLDVRPKAWRKWLRIVKTVCGAVGVGLMFGAKVLADSFAWSEHFVQGMSVLLILFATGSFEKQAEKLAEDAAKRLRGTEE
jgi:hypothetical protein